MSLSHFWCMVWRKRLRFEHMQTVSKQAGGWIHFCMKRLRTLNSYQIFKIKIKNQKPVAVDVLFKACRMVPLLCRSNLAGRYLSKSFVNFSWVQTVKEVYWERGKKGAFGKVGKTTTKKCEPLPTLFSLLCKLLKSSVKFLFYAVLSHWEQILEENCNSF